VANRLKPKKDSEPDLGDRLKGNFAESKKKGEVDNCGDEQTQRPSVGEKRLQLGLYSKRGKIQ